MQTTKQTVITLDDGDSIIVRIKTGSGYIQAALESRAQSEDANPALVIKTSEVVWLNGSEVLAEQGTTVLASEGEELTITLV